MAMDTIQETKTIQLGNRKSIKLNEKNLTIDLCSNDEILESLELDYPSAGYGGGSIHLSPSKSKVVFTYYSGQSEEAFSIFELNNQLKTIFESVYFFGEAASYCFNRDESLFVQVLPRTCTEWWLPWEDGDLEEDEDCGGYFEFCDINILNMSTHKLSHHTIRVKPASTWQPPTDAEDPLLYPEFISESELSIRFPWGKTVLTLPFPKLITYELPNA